jgi:hypothetical protein
MFRHKSFFVLALLVMIVSACAPAPTATPVPPTAAPKPAATVAPTAVPPTAVPPTAAPKPTEAPKPTDAPKPAAVALPTIMPTAVPKTDAGKAIVAKFNDPKQTIEYHFLLDIKGITEKDLATTAQKLVVDPLKPIVALEPLPAKSKPTIYIDSRDYALANNTLIVRVRSGDITIKSRASNPDALIDLKFCSSGKYEMDYSDVPFYAVSTTISFPPEEFATMPPGLTVPGLWTFIDKKCPTLWTQLKPYVDNAKGLEIPGVANMYSANGKLQIKNDANIEEVSFTIWFAPPIDKYLVEYAFTGFVKDRPIIEKIYAETTDFAKKAGLLSQSQATKTESYFNFYFGTKTPIK